MPEGKGLRTEVIGAKASKPFLHAALNRAFWIRVKAHLNTNPSQLQVDQNRDAFEMTNAKGVWTGVVQMMKTGVGAETKYRHGVETMGTYRIGGKGRLE